MNIFYLSHDPDVAARVMYNRHVVKMILESAQLLCTAHHELGNHDVPYKSTHKNHPSAIWTRSNDLSYMWVYEHMIALGEEYKRRYGRTHLTIDKCRDVLMDPPAGIPSTEWLDPPQCMPEQYKCGDTVEAYWNYYEGEKFAVANADETKITRLAIDNIEGGDFY